MRSKLFDRFDPTAQHNEPFKTHLKKTLSLKDDIVQKVIVKMPAIVTLDAEAEIEVALDQLQKETGESKAVLINTINLLSFFLNKLANDECEEDTPEEWSEDLVALDVLTADEKLVFDRYFSELVKCVKAETNVKFKAKKSTVGVLPSFSGISSTVELRGIPKQRYRFGTSHSEYSPEFEGLVPIASVALSVDAGANPVQFFQIDENDLRHLIEHLQATLREIQVLKNSTLKVV